MVRRSSSKVIFLDPEKDKLLPKGWIRVSLGSTALPGHDNFVDGDWIETPFITDSGIRFIQTGNIGIGQFIDKPDQRKFISEDSFQALRCRWVHPGDLLICRLADPIGRTCEVPEGVGNCVTSVDCTIFRPDPAKLEKRFAVHLLNSDWYLRLVARIAAGSTRQRISRKNLSRVFLCIPSSTSEQQNISRILDAADEEIAKTEALIAKLKAIKPGLLHDLLTRGLDENGELRDPERHPEQFKATPLGMRPRNWTLQRLGQMCELLNGLAFKPTDWSSTGLPIIRIQNLNRGEEFNYYDGVVADKYYIDPGTLLFSWSGNRGTSFGPFIWPGPRGILNQHIFKVTPKPGVRQRWFYYALDEIRQRVERVAHGGSGLVHIRRSDLCEYLIATPDEEEQERIENTIETHDERIDQEEAYLVKLKAIKRGLMQDLLTGRVRVNMKQETREE